MKIKLTLFLGLLTLGLFSFSLNSFAAWYNTSWIYRVQVTHDPAKVSTDQSDIPLYIDLSNMPDSFFANAKSDGSDLVVTDGDEVTVLDHELAYFDASNKRGELHVKLPNLSSSTANTIYIYYGNPLAADSSNSGSVWNGYEGVWHLNGEGGGVSAEKAGVVNQAAMDGGDGGWINFFGEDPVGNQLSIVVDEDQISDAERAHTTEQAGYWIFDGLTDIQDQGGVIIGEVGKVSNVGSVDKVVSLNNSYTNPVILTTPSLALASDAPAVPRIHSVLSDSFTVYLQNPGDLSVPTAAEVHYIVLEAGAHTLPGGVSVEAGVLNGFTGVNRSGDWDSNEMVEISPTHAYTNPVVLGQVMSVNDAAWQVFWSSNGSRTTPATSTDIYIGRHVGGDSLQTRVAEDIGYLIIEEISMAFTNGVEYAAQVGADNIEGVDNDPPYTYTAFDSMLTGSLPDSTLNGYDAQISGLVSGEGAGQVGRSVHFSGEANAYLAIEDLNYSNSNSLNQLTAGFWLKTGDTARSGIFDFDRSDHWELGLNFHNAGGQAGTISFDTANSANGIRDMNSSTTVNNGQWRHVVAVFDSTETNDKKIYIDGVLDSQQNDHSTGLGTNTLRYGFFGDGSEAGSFDGSRNNLRYEGFLDQAFLIHQALDSNLINTFYENQGDNANFWTFGPEVEVNYPPKAPTTPYLDHTSAQAGQTNPNDLTVDGDDNRVLYFSAIYEDDNSGDIANEARIQVSTDPTFVAITHWDSGWASISDVTEGNRSADIEYDNFGNAAILPLAMDDGTVTYYWRIAFKDDEPEEGSFSANQSFTLLDVPTAPSGLSATKNEGSPDTFTLSWNDNSTNENEFKVQVSEDGGGFTDLSDSPFAADVTTGDDNNTQDNAAYDYQIQACNYAGCSAYHQDATTYYTDQDMPTDVYAAYVDDDEFTVHFTDQSVIEEVRIERCVGLTDCGADTYALVQSNVSTTQGNPETLTDDDASIVANETFRWRVRADNGTDTSQYTVSAYEYTTPAEPTDLAPVYTSDTSIDLTWTDNSAHEDGFRIQVSEDGGPFVEITPSANTVGANVTNYTYTAATANHSYDFKIQAHVGATANNAELFSNEVNAAATVYTSPAALTSLTQDYISDTQIDLTWVDNAAYETGIAIYVEENGGGSVLETTLVADSTSYTYASGNNESNYKFIVEPVISANAPYNPTDLTTPSVQTAEVYTSAATPGLAFDSSTPSTIDWLVTDNATTEDGFNLYKNDGTTLAQQYAIVDLATITEGGLDPNTQYSRTLAAYTDNPNTTSNAAAVSPVSAAVSAYTLANAPTNVQASDNGLSAGTVQILWEDNDNPSGTEYFAQNNVLGTNSGWITTLQWQEGGLDCNTAYTFQVMARNADGITTVDSPVNFSYECEEEAVEITSSPGGGYDKRTLDALFDMRFDSPEAVEESGPEISSDSLTVEQVSPPSIKDQSLYIRGDCSVPFPDINTHEHAEYIADLYCQNIIHGYPNGSFQPEELVNRVEFLKMLLQAFGIPTSEQVTLSLGQEPFLDGPLDSWYAQYLYTAVDLGVVTGYDDGTFRPDQPVSKSEALAMVLRIAGENPQITDSSLPWYVPYIERGEELGLYEGFFAPNELLKRGEASKILSLNLNLRLVGVFDELHWGI